MRIYSTGLKTIAIFFCVALLAPSCLKDKLTRTYTILTPVYETKQKVLSNIKANTPITVSTPGKIYLYGKYIFLNEINKGVHIIDNANPSKPVNVAFINIPGNLDIAVKGNILYADFYTDLLSIDISNPLSAKMSKLLPDVFPQRKYENWIDLDTTRIIVDWIKKDTTIDISQNTGNYGWLNCNRCLFASANSFADGSKSSSSVPGIAGSMARFAIVNDYLYAVNNTSLETIKISNAPDLSLVQSDNVGWNIETIFPFKDKLFIGSASGMFIYDIYNPASPERKGNFQHLRACDPVIADDNYAFVTLRSGTTCQGFSNQLDILDISDLNAPSLLRTYNLTNPHGLSKDGNILFICDGKDGLKVYDASNVNNLKLLKHLTGMETYDVIAWNKRLILVSQSGLSQYDYSDINNILLLSTISINR
ncbi:MAG: LVIVD repeat-containing protein [Chitinophagaceae bacterium]